MNEAVRIAREVESVRSQEEILADISACARGMAENMVRMAELILEAEQAGVSLAALRDQIGRELVNHLRQVADGRLDPEVIRRFFGKNRLITAIGGLTSSEQKQIAAGEPVPFLVFGAGGHPEREMRDPGLLRGDEIRQVFAQDHIRTDEEQRVILDQQRRKAVAPKPSKVGDLTPDAERVGAWLGRRFIPLADMQAVIRALKK